MKKRICFKSDVSAFVNLTVDATIGNQAFSQDGCNIFPGLRYNNAITSFFNSLRKNEVEAQAEITLQNYGKG